MSAEGFVHLRVRSAYSLLEGAIKADKIGKLAAAAAMPAVAIADRADLFGALEFSQACKDAGVQPVIGCALPVVGLAAQERYTRAPTLVVLAQSEAGWLNLMTLSSLAYLEPAGDEPSVTWETLAQHAEGLILLSGGPDGPVDPLFAAGQKKEAWAALQAMEQVFGDRFYIELQRHGLASEKTVEPRLVEYAYERDVALVATNDVYFAEKSMYRAHDALLAISERSFLGEDNRRRVTAEHWFKTPALMRETFKDLPEACDNTLDIARRCAFLVKKRDPILPRFDTGAGRNEAEELAWQAREGLKARLADVELAHPEADYWARLEFEIGVVQNMGFSGYFLIVSDFIKWAKAHGVPVGPGRGSGAGSLVAWSLTITGLDPLRFGLLFERFLNPERVSMPDFDIDFCQERRERVIGYVQEKYGRDRVAQIITFGTLQARAVLRDVGRVMQLPLGQVDRLAKMVPNNPAAPVTLQEAIKLEPRLQQASRDDEAVKRLFETATALEGLYRNASTHAAGVVIADRPLTELVPLYQDPRAELPATQYNMKWVESAGLVKFDFLGLKTLTVLDRAHALLKKRGADVDFDRLSLDDQATYDMMDTGQTIGVFQLEGQGMRDTLRKMRCRSLEELTALNALYRPGPMDNIDLYLDCKFGRRAPDMLHPSLEPVLKETYGVIVYQEQVMQIAQILAGYSLGEADLLRRAMGKKKKEEMDQQKARFIQGAEANGVPRQNADYIFDLVAKFAGYGFNKSHACAYSYISFQTGWLKAHHPVEFFAANMSLDIANTDKLAVFYQDARRFGVTVASPDINRSMADFDVEEGQVLYALGAVRNVGMEAMKSIVAAREQGGPFTDIFDFLERVDPRALNKRALENLARAGAFDKIHPNRRQIVESADHLIAHMQSVAEDRASAQVNLFGADHEAVKPRLPKIEPWVGPERLDEELAAVGFYLSGHPLEDLVDVLRRKRTTLYAEALQQAEDGKEAFRMAGIVRRRQERASAKSGDKFAFVTLSDPTGEYEVYFAPEALRACRDVLESGAAISLKVRCKANDGEVRFYGEDATPIEKAVEAAAVGLRVHLSPRSTEVEALKSRLETASTDRGGEVTFVAALEGGREVEVRLPGRYRLDASLRGALKSSPGVLMLEDA
ncbi:MAG TPA: DNA polymerase III subunit alpha [Caulobacteraceae bacterium]|nr:DNA polymerase III subunit alpha [Caulobacteraceae bacterium]